MSLQIDAWCAETGIEVEGHLKETVEGRDERNKKSVVAKYTLAELLRDDFAPQTEPEKKYRSVKDFVDAHEEGPGESSAIDIEDVQ